MPKIEIYKRNQGKYTRVGTLLAGLLMAGIGAILLGASLSTMAFVSEHNMARYVQFGVPVLLILGAGALLGWIVNRPRSADFLIATEGEMKKVSWSSRKEIIGSTKVVIVTTVIISSLLLAVDLMFIWLFSRLGLGMSAG